MTTYQDFPQIDSVLSHDAEPLPLRSSPGFIDDMPARPFQLPYSPTYESMGLVQLSLEILIYTYLHRARLRLLNDDIAAASQLIQQAMHHVRDANNPELEAKCLHHRGRIEAYYRQAYGTDMRRRDSDPSPRVANFSQADDLLLRKASLASNGSLFNRLMFEVQESPRLSALSLETRSPHPAGKPRSTQLKPSILDLRRISNVADEDETHFTGISETFKRVRDAPLARQPNNAAAKRNSKFVGIDELLNKKGVPHTSLPGSDAQSDIYEHTTKWAQGLACLTGFASPNYIGSRPVSEAFKSASTHANYDKHKSSSMVLREAALNSRHDKEDPTSNVNPEKGRSTSITTVASTTGSFLEVTPSVSVKTSKASRLPRLSSPTPSQPWVRLTATPPITPGLPPLPPSRRASTHVPPSPTHFISPTSPTLKRPSVEELTPASTATPSLTKLLTQINANPSSYLPQHDRPSESQAQSPLTRLRRLSVDTSATPSPQQNRPGPGPIRADNGRSRPDSKDTNGSRFSSFTGFSGSWGHDISRRASSDGSPHDSQASEPIHSSPLRTSFVPEEGDGEEGSDMYGSGTGITQPEPQNTGTRFEID